MEYARLQSMLIAKIDPKYLLFCGPIVNAKTPLLGVRMPDLHEIAKKIIKDKDDVKTLPFHQSVEMDIVIGFCRMQSNDALDDKYQFLNAFLPGVDNWMVIDSLASSFSTKDYGLGLRKIKQYAKSKAPFERRFAYIHFLDNFIQKDKVNDIFKIVKPDAHYYVKMAIAWLLCECFVRYPNETEVYLANNVLDDWTINKAILRAKKSALRSIVALKKLAYNLNRYSEKEKNNG
ncbi:MAG: DNA alkylation repair protein [Firmicutes bacterium]|nr:DNA alkylation repair protein [Bacillota bacterium]